ncbi:unnamed protein product, partial [marine sediment metagenome]
MLGFPENHEARRAVSLGQRIRQRRLALNITQQDLADALKITP